MKPFLLAAILLAILQQATAIPYGLTLGNVSVQTEIQSPKNGFHVEIPHMEMASSHL